MTDPSQWLDAFNLLIKSLHSAPTYAVFCSCVVVGYVFRCIKSFPNGGIPALVVSWGALANTIMSNEHGPSLTLSQERFLAGMIGMVIGLLAWLFHKKLLKKLETKVPFLANMLDSGNSNPNAFVKGQNAAQEPGLYEKLGCLDQANRDKLTETPPKG